MAAAGNGAHDRPNAMRNSGDHTLSRMAAAQHLGVLPLNNNRYPMAPGNFHVSSTHEMPVIPAQKRVSATGANALLGGYPSAPATHGPAIQPQTVSAPGRGPYAVLASPGVVTANRPGLGNANPLGNSANGRPVPAVPAARQVPLYVVGGLRPNQGLPQPSATMPVMTAGGQIPDGDANRAQGPTAPSGPQANGATRATKASEKCLSLQRLPRAKDVKADAETLLQSLGSSTNRPAQAHDGIAVAGDPISTGKRSTNDANQPVMQPSREVKESCSRVDGTNRASSQNDAPVRNGSSRAGNINPFDHPACDDDANGSGVESSSHLSGSGGYYDQDVSNSYGNLRHVNGGAERRGHFKGDARNDTGITFEGDRSFASHQGEVEWLRVPSLFYLFANIIKWNELQLQRRALAASFAASQQNRSQSSASLHTEWTEGHEQELQTLEDRISFSVFELEGIYLNPLLMRWSEPKLLKLVSGVASTWKQEGPQSLKFEEVSARLFDAISNEEPCQMEGTWMLSLHQWIGKPEHRWAITGILIACFVVAIVCIVLLAALGRTRVAVCAALSAVLGVAVILMYTLAMFVLHHNTYATAAATFFRETAVQAAQVRMEEEEEDEEHNVSRLVEVEGHSGRETDTGMYITAADGAAVDDSAYDEDQMAVAARNLRALTEGTTQPAASAPVHHQIPVAPSGAARNPGTAVAGYYDDAMTLTEDRAPSLSSHPVPVRDAAAAQSNKRDEDLDDTLLMSFTTYEQHKEYMEKRQSKLVRDSMLPTSAQRGEIGKQIGVARERGRNSSVSAAAARKVSGDATRAQQLQQLAHLPGKVSITALIYCDDAGALSEVAHPLWARMFMILRLGDLRALDHAFQHGSDRFKVILIHAADAADGSEVLRTTLMWRQVERRPVFFFSRAAHSASPSIPSAARLRLPLSATSVDTLLLAGVGASAELASISFPAVAPRGSSESQPFQVPPYLLGRRLGGGAFGNVFEAEMEETGAKCAVKRMYLKEDADEDGHEAEDGTANAGRSSSAGAPASTPPGTAAAATSKSEETAVGSQLRDIAQEVEIMSSLQHPNIVRYYFCERDDNCISIFMELCTGGSLSSLIHSGKLVHPPEIKLLLREIVSAVAYLHNLRIVHRDLKPDNVLFRHGHAKLTDFGTAVHKHGSDLRVIKGTFAYMAPETLVGEPYGSACDVWSIGCIAAEVLSVELPQHALDLPAMCEYYRAMGPDSALAIECDVPGARDFLLACLQRNPLRRSTAAELFYHPMLQARDDSIATWMGQVVEQRQARHAQQRQSSYRHGGAGRGNGVPGSSRGGALQNDSVDGFDLDSGNGSAISLDSSHLVAENCRQDESLLSN